MKYIILAAGKGQDSLSENNNIPKCLLKVGGKTSLDNMLKISKILSIPDINVIAGYEILKIMNLYPHLKYFYNEEWQDTNSLYSLSKALYDFDDDLLISYSDILYTKSTIKKLVKNKDSINIAYDSLWEKRYEGRSSENTKIEKVILNNNKVRFSKETSQGTLIGEYSGLVFIPQKLLVDVRIATEKLLLNNKRASIIDLIDSLSLDLNDVNLVDVQANWAELDSLQDIEHFNFGTKAETLNSIKKKIKIANILDQYTFTVSDYNQKSDLIIKNIQSKFKSNLLVVRSSALNEDTENSSMAGNYESILKVPKDDYIKIKEAIEKVIDSYKKNNQKQDKDNQVLVQPYLQHVTMSGVVFSKDLQSSSPYYTINYDNSSDTETVTSGNGINLNTFICYNSFETEIENHFLKILINAIKEIESITNYDAIDVEFAFENEVLYILQVRPIAAKKDTLKVSTTDIDVEIKNIKNFLDIKNPNLLGRKIAFGIMPDWNPAEIIGINPKPLAFDLYKYIITDNVWAQSRKNLGYRDVKNTAGLISLSGKPYVDIRMSFNTFIPKSLDNTLADKLVDFYLDKLEKNPENHDKVEFQVAITAYDFSIDSKIDEMKNKGFSEAESILIKKSYKQLTEDIILEKQINIKQELEKTMQLTKKRELILASNMDKIDKIYNLLEDCKTYGTLPFANLARLGFIGSIFLKSLLANNVIDENEYGSFFKSIKTVAKEFMDDFNLLLSSKLSKEKFISKYGHLRPGTYDITSFSYKEKFDEYIDFSSKITANNESHQFQFTTKTKNRLEQEIASHQLKFTSSQLINFIVRTTEAREKAKFEFTKSLSSVLDLISEIGKDFGLERNDLSYLNLRTLLSFKDSSSKIDLYNIFKQNISQNRQKYLITTAIKLPDLIFNKKDIEMFYYPSLKPNYISHHSLSGEFVFLKLNNEEEIDNKIVLIENADPGFDWIFSHNIKGLVTKFGGAASHMAIRCAEFDLPAAIGCGDKIFNDLLHYKKIHLDCVNNKIQGLL